MKKYYLLILYSFLFFYSSSQNISIIENYESMNFEIKENNKLIAEFPFGRFYGYQQQDNKFFFIDCINSRISEYGEICYFDVKSKKTVYTGVFSGSSFYVTKDLKKMVVSCLTDTKQANDIEDVFGIIPNTKQYPLNIAIYDFDNLKKIQEFSLAENIAQEKLSCMYVELLPKSDNQLQIRFGEYDSSVKVNCGILDLKEMKFLQ